jgi:tetratricopeptide (TPR) repeat protein
LRASQDAEVRGLAAVVEAHLLLLEDRFDEAGELFEVAIRRGGKTWADQTALYMVGDCHLLAGRPQAALRAYARGVAHARDMGARDDIGFQAEGIVAAFADLGLDEEALHTLGASDRLTGEGVLPREHNAYWGGVMAGRIASARAALGTPYADAAYARGHALSVEEVVELLLSYGASVAPNAVVAWHSRSRDPSQVVCTSGRGGGGR